MIGEALEQFYCRLTCQFTAVRWERRKLPFMRTPFFWMILFFGVANIALASDSPITSANKYRERARYYNTMSQYAKSVISFREALALYTLSEKWEEVAQCLNGIADNLVREGEFGHALDTLNMARKLEKRKLSKHNVQRIQTDLQLGYLLSYEDNPDDGISYIREALNSERTTADYPRELFGAAYYTLGIAYRAKGDYDSALVALKSASRIQLSETADSANRVALANSLMLIGTVFDYRTECDSAIAYLRQAADVLHENHCEHSPSGAACFIYLANAYSNAAILDSALLYLSKAVDLNKALYGEMHPAMTACYVKVGEVYEGRGDYDSAIKYYEKALRMAKQLNGDLSSGVASIYTFIARLYFDRNDFGRAKVFFLKALSIQRRTLDKLHPFVAFTYQGLAAACERNGEYPKAMEYCQHALQLRQAFSASNDRDDLLELNTLKGAIYSDMGQYSLALSCLKEAVANRLEGYDERIAPPYVSPTYKQIAQVYRRKGEYANALRYIQRALFSLESGGMLDTSLSVNPDARRVTQKFELLQLLATKGEYCEEACNTFAGQTALLKYAFSAYEGAVNLENDLLNVYTEEGSKYELVERSRTIREGALRTSLRLFSLTGDSLYEEEAFRIAEENRARVLVDGVERAAAQRYAGIPDSLLQREKSLKSEITYCETELQREREQRQGSSIRRVVYLQNRSFALSQELQDLSRTFEVHYPRYHALRHENNPFDIRAAERSIPATTGFIEYFVSDTTLYIFTLTSGSYHVTEVRMSSHVEHQAKEFVRAIKTFDPGEYVRLGRDLYQALIEPVRDYIAEIKHLIVIPDGDLSCIPFGALICSSASRASNSTDPKDFTLLHYLIQDYAISYDYSIGFYLVNTGREQRGGVGKSFIGFAPGFQRRENNNSYLSATKDHVGNGDILRQLKYSRFEVDSIATMLSEDGVKTATFFSDSATEANFKKRIGAYTYIHVASHGYVDEEHPDLSGIFFSKPKLKSAFDDGVLYAGETYNLTLHADLVVLSSCESGMGKIVKGEGILALTRGFFYAGAHNVVFSLWQVDDRETYQLMLEFYRDMRDGKSFSSALRSAKLAMIANRRSAFPWNWSGFLLMGQ